MHRERGLLPQIAALHTLHDVSPAGTLRLGLLQVKRRQHRQEIRTDGQMRPQPCLPLVQCNRCACGRIDPHGARVASDVLEASNDGGPNLQG